MPSDEFLIRRAALELAVQHAPCSADDVTDLAIEFADFLGRTGAFAEGWMIKDLKPSQPPFLVVRHGSIEWTDDPAAAHRFRLHRDAAKFLLVKRICCDWLKIVRHPHDGGHYLGRLRDLATVRRRDTVGAGDGHPRDLAGPT